MLQRGKFTAEISHEIFRHLLHDLKQKQRCKLVLFLWSCVRWLEIIIEDRSGMLFQWRLLTASARIRLQGLTKRAALLPLWKLLAFSRLEKMSSRSSCPRPHWRRSSWHLCYHPQCKAAPCAPRIDASHSVPRRLCCHQQQKNS